MQPSAHVLSPVRFAARRRGSRAGPDSPAKRRAPARGRRGGPWGWIALLALVIAAGATWWLGARRPAPPASSPAPAAIPAAPGDWEAYDRGIALVRAERYAEALPYLERGLNDSRWETYHDLAATWVNWTSAGRTRAGHEVPISRSSWERIAATQRALALVEHAQAMVKTDRDRADLLGFRAMVLSSWGLGWDAMIDYQNMVAADSTWALAIASRNLQARKMRYPERDSQ